MLNILNTETPSQHHPDLDLYDSARLVAALVEDQQAALVAVKAASPALAAAVEAAVPRIRRGGRLLYAGAGTSGRLGVLDSVELTPTFSWPGERAVAMIAGGESAMFVAVEGAEDDEQQGRLDIEAAHPRADDVLLGIAASGQTPYVLGALAAGRAAGCLCIGFSNNPGTAVLSASDLPILLDTGPEIISGSTRLKAGTAQKMALNAFSSALMVRLNKVYGNLMVDMKATNAKLVRRAVALTMRAAGVDETSARQALDQCDFSVKTAVVMLLKQVPADEALRLLDAHAGSVRAALARP